MRILVCLLFVAFSRAAYAELLTLEDARQFARATRAEMAVHQARLDRAHALIRRVGATRRPRLVGTFDLEAAPGSELVFVKGSLDEADLDNGEPFLVAASRPIDEGIEAFAPQFRYGAFVGVEWNLYDFGRTAATRTAAHAEERARRADRVVAERVLTTQVDAAYLAWLGAEERAALEEDNIRAARRRLADLEVRVGAGSAAPSTRLAARADLAIAELAQAEVESERRTARLLLEETLGRALAPDAHPDPRLLDRIRVSTATGADPAAAAWAARADAARATAKSHLARTRPQLTASALAGVRGQLTTVFPAYRAQVTLQVPLWDGGVARADADAARAEARELATRRAEAKRTASQATRRAWETLKTAVQKVDLATSLVGLVEARARDARERFDEGAASPAELRAIDADLLQARATLLSARLARTQAVLDLERR